MNSWSTPELISYLEEAQIRGSLVLLCASPAVAKRLRWALYHRGTGEVRVAVKGCEVKLSVPEKPKVVVKE